MLSPDGLTLFFTSGRSDKAFNIYVTKQNDRLLEFTDDPIELSARRRPRRRRCRTDSESRRSFRVSPSTSREPTTPDNRDPSRPARERHGAVRSGVRLVAELADASTAAVPGWLSPDRCRLYYVHDANNEGELSCRARAVALKPDRRARRRPSRGSSARRSAEGAGDRSPDDDGAARGSSDPRARSVTLRS